MIAGPDGVATFQTVKQAFLTATATNISSGNTSEFGLSDYSGDGIYDAWKVHGIDWNLDGTPDQLLPDSRVGRKDVYVEVDGMNSLLPTQATMDRVAAAFANAPVAGGLALHIDMSTADVLPATEWPSSELATVKQDYFGTTAQRNDPNWENIRPARLLVYRYCFFAKAITDDHYFSSGRTLRPGDDVLITLGSEDRFDASGKLIGAGWIHESMNSDVQAGTFMHELGHSLGLDHGGGGTDPATLAERHQ